MARFTRTIVAGSGTRIDVSGTVIKVVESSGVVNVLPDNRNEAREMRGGDNWILRDPVKDPTFKVIEFANTTADDVTFTIDVFNNGNDSYESDSAAIVNVGVHGVTQSGNWNVATTEKPPIGNADGNVDVLVTSTLVVAANALNRRVSIQPQGGTIYVRKGSAATTSLGIKVTDGSLYECDTTQAIYAISPVGTIPTYFDVTRL